jgi:hypothetical protein
MVSERRGIFLSYQFSAISRQEFFSEHSTEKRYIARDIDRLTRHWDAGSAPRAAASETPVVGYCGESLSQPLAVLIP